LERELAGPEISTPSYWVRHVRDAVRFGDGVQALHEAGATRFVELGPKATLLGLVSESLPVEPPPALFASLRAERPEAEAVLEALGGHYGHGGAVDWKAVFPSLARRVELPTYAWQRERHWIEGSGSVPDAQVVHEDPARAATATAGDVERILGADARTLIADTTLAAAGLDSLALTTLRSTLLKLPGGRDVARELSFETPLATLWRILDESSARNATPGFELSVALESLGRVTWSEVTPRSVNKASAANVMLVRAALESDRGRKYALAELSLERSHPFLYDHPLDHLSGMQLIESARQLLNWAQFTTEGKLESGGTLDHVQADFIQFVEHDEPAYLAAVLDGGPFDLHVVQSNRIKAVVTVAGHRIESLEYLQLRSRQRTPPT
jgi:acyl transferase domain-containing protein